MRRTVNRILASLCLCATLLTTVGCGHSPRVVLRAVRAFVAEPTVLVDELPEHQRPVHRVAETDNGADESAPGSLRVLSYNIQRAYKEDEIVVALEALLAAESPDVVLLQETPEFFWTRPGVEQLFADMNLFYAPFHQVEKPSKRFPHRSYGQLIATPLALEARRVIELPTVTRAGLGRHHVLKRIALYAEIPLHDGRSVRLINTHNEPFVRPRGRSPQFQAALDRLEPSRRHVNLYCGDLNTAFGQDEPGLHLFRNAGYESALTADAELDDCLASGHQTIDGRILEDDASDHRPIVVDVVL